MNLDSIATKYLSSNNVTNNQGSDILEKANTDIDQTDRIILDELKSHHKTSDLYLALIFVLIAITFGLMSYKMINDINNDFAFFGCIGVIFILLAIAHRVWKDKIRAEEMFKILPFLGKKDRLKIVIAITTNEKDLEFQKFLEKFRIPGSPV